MIFNNFDKIEKRIEEIKNCNSNKCFLIKLNEFYNQLKTNYHKYIQQIKKYNKHELEKFKDLETITSSELQEIFQKLKSNKEKIIEYTGSYTGKLIDDYPKNKYIFHFLDNRNKYEHLKSIINLILKQTHSLDNIIKEVCGISKDRKILEKTFCKKFQIFEKKTYEIIEYKKA